MGVNHAITGGCLCGAVKFQIGKLPDCLSACHCRMCRKLTGHFFVSASVKLKDFTWLAEEGVGWYRSSTIAERGFCKRCGSHLFYRPIGKDRIEIAAGAIDDALDIPIRDHIFVANKGGYYHIDDSEPQYLDAGPYSTLANP